MSQKGLHRYVDAGRKTEDPPREQKQEGIPRRELSDHGSARSARGAVSCKSGQEERTRGATGGQPGKGDRTTGAAS